MNIKEQRYSSSEDFVNRNNLQNEAKQLFGENWEPEFDIEQIRQLLDFVGCQSYDVKHIHGLKNDDDIEVSNNLSLEIALKKLAILDSYFDSFPKDIQNEINEEFENQGLSIH